MTNGVGGIGGTINANPKPTIANPTTFIFLNGSSGSTGSTSQNNSYSNANVGYGGGGGSGGGIGGSGGAGAYVEIIYNGGQIANAYVLNYVLGNAGTGGANSGGTGGIKVTWT
jgi:hypothetical protein